MSRTTVENTGLEKEQGSSNHPSRARFFHHSQPAPVVGHRTQSDAVTSLLQHVVYGREQSVHYKLESVKGNAAQLSALLSDVSTVKDYSGRTISDMTLLQASASAGDIDMCRMLKNYLSQEEFSAQLAELFPGGIEAHERDQLGNIFNFDTIFAAIRGARDEDLDAALSKAGAEWTETDSARAKPDRALSLTEALNRFRAQFFNHSCSEKIFNPCHLLRAFELYGLLHVQSERDNSALSDKKRDLFECQVMGFCQLMMPACYMQAFSQGLYYLVKVNQLDSWGPENFDRYLTLRESGLLCFPLFEGRCCDLGFDFAISPISSRAHWSDKDPLPTPLLACSFIRKFVSDKNSWLSAHCAAMTLPSACQA
jgi:hypothetical protein